MIISRTPYRISFFGGGTDYPIWYLENGGEVLASTINQYCYLTCRFLPSFFEHKIRIVYSKIETCKSIDEIIHPSAREVLRYLKFEEGIEIHHDGDLPARSGVGSSSAFTVCLLHALHTLQGKNPTKEQLAQESIRIERDILRETVGSQDQVQTAFGGFNHLIFNRDGSFEVRPMNVASERCLDLESQLMLFFTGTRRTSSEIASSYVQNLRQKEKGLDRLKELVGEARLILEGAGELADFGHLLHESWLIKSSWSDQVSPAHIQEMYFAARNSGALGGKLIGAGGGGFLLLFVPIEFQVAVRERLGWLLEIPIALESKGAQIIFNDELRRHDFGGHQWLDLQKELATARGIRH